MASQKPDPETGKLPYRGTIQTMQAVAAKEGAMTLYNGFLPYFMRCGGHTVLMFFMVEELQKKHVPFPHVYVNVMAVHPDAQGKGFCSLMMRLVNEYADSLNLPLWLETSGTRNVEIYKKFGYEVIEQFTVETANDPDNSEPLTDEFCMLRPAANPKATQPLRL